MYPISLTTELSGSYSWYGSLISNDIILDISEEANLELFSVDEADYLSFIFTNQTGTGELDLTLNISIKGCMDPSALNYHPEAIYDDGSCKFPNNLISIYPNPINLTVNTLNIIYDLYEGEIYLEIFDLNGKSISSNLFSLSYGRQYINYNSRLDIPSGIYFLKVSAGNKTDFIKLVNIK